MFVIIYFRRFPAPFSIAANRKHTLGRWATSRVWGGHGCPGTGICHATQPHRPRGQPHGSRREASSSTGAQPNHPCPWQHRASSPWRPPPVENSSRATVKQWGDIFTLGPSVVEHALGNLLQPAGKIVTDVFHEKLEISSP